MSIAPQCAPRRASEVNPTSMVFLLLAVVWIGCTSGPVLAFHGARHYAVGSEALEQGEAERAITELSEAARLVPHASEIQNHLGLAYWTAGQLDDARSAFERAVELDCDNHVARANLARVTNAPGVGPTTGGSDRNGG